MNNYTLFEGDKCKREKKMKQSKVGESAFLKSFLVGNDMRQAEFQRVFLYAPKVKLIRRINRAVEKNWIEALRGVHE